MAAPSKDGSEKPITHAPEAAKPEFQVDRNSVSLVMSLQSLQSRFAQQILTSTPEHHEDKS